MRLIDADDLKKAIRKTWLPLNREWLIMTLDEIIDNAPVVELQMRRMVNGVIIPIKRPQGEWKKHDTWDYSCSICGALTSVDDGIVEDLPNFCPCCGAYMKGGAK